MSSAPRNVSSLGSPGPAPMMYTRIAISHATKNGVLHDLPYAKRHFAEPPRVDRLRDRRVVVLGAAHHEAPEPLAHRTRAADHEAFREAPRELLAFEFERQLRADVDGPDPD